MLTSLGFNRGLSKRSYYCNVAMEIHFSAYTERPWVTLSLEEEQEMEEVMMERWGREYIF
jgi:hypothetical protein